MFPYGNNKSKSIYVINRLVDVLEEGYDLVLRSAKLESSNLIAQRIFSIKNTICATEQYFKQHGIAKIPNNLEKHNCATYSYLNDAKHITLIKNNHETVVHIQGNFISNHLDLIKQMVLNNLCIGIFPEFMVANELQEKKLHRCLVNYQLPESQLYAIYPARKFMLPKLKYFLEMLKSYLNEK